MQFLLLSGIDSATGVGGQLFAAFWCCLGYISGVVLATFRYSFCGCFGACFLLSGTDSAGVGGHFMLLSGAVLASALVQLLLLSGIYSAGGGR